VKIVLMFPLLTLLLEPVAETVAAPVITDAVPPVESKEETKEIEPKKEEPKATRRQSRFESFFGKKTAEKAPEAKEPEVAPISDTPPTIETTEPAAVAPVEGAAETPAETVEKDAEATTPTKERKPSMLAGLKSFTQKVRSPSSEHPPAVAAAPVEPSTAATTTEAPAAATEAPATETAVEETPATNGLPTDSKEKRRSSFFNIEALKSKLPKGEKKSAAPEPSTSVEEPVKTEAVEEAAKPAEETAAVETAAEPEKKSTEATPVEPKAEKEPKQSPLTQLGRRVSKVIRGDRAKKETKPVPKVEETSEHAPKLPEPVAEPALTDPSAETEKPTAPTSIGDVVPEAVNIGTAPTANATVSATA
jgi:hypothetical protein